MILSTPHTIDGGTFHLIVCICGATVAGSVRVAGSVQIRCDAKHKVVAKLHSIFVAEAERGHDIGTDLMQRAEEIARQEGCEAIGLHIDLTNLDVRPFYEKLGYVAVYQFEDGDVQFVKRLTPFEE